MALTLLVGTRKGLFTLQRSGSNGGTGWKITNAQFLGDNVSMLLADPRDGQIHVALDHGHFGVKMHRAPALGADFEELPAPAYPEKPEDDEDLDMWGKPLPWTTLRVWALEAGGADQPGLIWCGTVPGGLFVSRDSGSTWEMVDVLWNDPKRREWFGGGVDYPGIHSILVDPRDSNIVRLGISCGGVWATRDGGKTWAGEGYGMWSAYSPPEHKFDPNTQDVHRLAQCRTAPERMWIQHHNGVFQSRDDGKTWTDVESVKPTTFGFTVAMHPDNPDITWLLPAQSDEKRVADGGRIVVARTTDGGETFEELTSGLPQEHAYDIVYRHGLDVCPRGENLAFGSTTGGLWISEDGGEHWQGISERLPPVYCVRFADL